MGGEKEGQGQLIEVEFGAPRERCPMSSHSLREVRAHRLEGVSTEGTSDGHVVQK